MDTELRQKLIEEAQERMKPNRFTSYDPAHDFSHTLRVLKNAEYIHSFEGGDLDIIVPAALYHDLVVYPKNNPKSFLSAVESAKLAREILQDNNFPRLKLYGVEQAIKEHPFSAGYSPSSLESQIIQDADRLEATGAISIMRTFNSGGRMERPFYNENDPLCESREPKPSEYTLDFFYTRLLNIERKLNTKTAKRLAKKRSQFLLVFLNQLKSELDIERGCEVT
jgi:uncharacterized protein